MRVFLTGASGFIGTNLLSDFVADGVEVTNFDINPPLNPAQHSYWHQGDILDLATLKKAVADFEPTHLVHLAARTDCDERETLAGYRANTDGTANVLEAIVSTASIERSIITSTQFVCQPGYLPSHDEDYNPHTVYGQSKVITEQLTRRADIPSVWTIIRPTTIWGPWLLRHKRQFFRVMKSGLYMHPGSQPCLRSWGYVGNVTYQIRKLLEAPTEQIDRKTYYVGDPPLNLLDWVNGFSRRITGRNARVVPRGFVRTLGLVGDVASFAHIPFPITTSRYRSMTQDYITPMERTLALVGQSPYSLDDGIEATMQWLAASEIAEPRAA